MIKIVALLLVVLVAVESMEMTGALEDADINSPEVKDALKFAVDKYNADSTSIYISRVVKVIKAQQQVVAGSNYIFTVVMAETTCLKAEAESTCAINPDADIAKPHECKLVVWSQPWLNSMKLTENTCA